MKFSINKKQLSHSLYYIIFAVFSQSVFATKVDVLILSPERESVDNVGISIVPVTPLSKNKSSPQPQIMNQIDIQFSPKILMAQKGAPISFPNSDSVKHHVYSFSDAKTFELQLYKDQKPEALIFDRVGTVTIGCNIHDWMLAYIYVVDTPFFNVTNESGFAQFNIPPGDYIINIHGPKLKGDDVAFTQKVSITKDSNFTLQLKNSITVENSEFDDGDEFDAY